MRTEDLLAACLEARAQGRSPTEILNQGATTTQQAELESLLDLVARLENLAPPSLPASARQAMTARLLAVTGNRPAGPVPLSDLSLVPEVQQLLLARWQELLRGGKRIHYVGFMH